MGVSGINNSDDFAIIIPTYKERDNLASLLPSLIVRYPRVTIYIIDDTSQDGTEELSTQLQSKFPDRLILESPPPPKSYGKALVLGIRRAIFDGYQTIVQMDADGSHNLFEIERLLSVDSDMVIGSRYFRNSRVLKVPFLRRCYSIVGNLYLSILWRTKVRDKTNGFRLYRQPCFHILESSKFESLGFSIQIEILRKILNHKNLVISEVPTTFEFRKIGQSKFNLRILWEAFLESTQIKK
jgi:dolichol-phosphate mannosyltransferase